MVVGALADRDAEHFKHMVVALLSVVAGKFTKGRFRPAHVGQNTTFDDDLGVVRHRQVNVTAAAQAIINIAIAKMSLAVREVSVAKGYDPRDFVLVAFGGGGEAEVTWRLHPPLVQALEEMRWVRPENVGR